MTLTSSKTDFPEFAASSFDAAINAALADHALPKFDTRRSGATNWRDGSDTGWRSSVSLKTQIRAGRGASHGQSSNSVQKTVGDVSITRTHLAVVLEQSQQGTAAIYNANAYGKVYVDDGAPGGRRHGGDLMASRA
jgi:hypothetical protein